MSARISIIAVCSRHSSPLFLRAVMALGVAFAVQATQGSQRASGAEIRDLATAIHSIPFAAQAARLRSERTAAPLAATVQAQIAATPPWVVVLAIVLVLIVIAACSAPLIYFRHPRAILGRCVRRITQAEESRDAEPEAALRNFDVAIRDLTKLRARRRLGRDAEILLGRAYVGSAIVLLRRNQLAEALPRIGDADELGTLEWDDVAPYLAPVYLDSDDRSDMAVWCYIHYLKMHAEQVDVEVAKRIASLLEEHARIRAEMDEDKRTSKMQVNLSLTTIPGAGTRIVIEQGNRAGTQVEIGGRTTIGTAAHHGIRLDDEIASESHACIDIDEEGAVLLSDQNSKTGTLVEGQVIEAPTRLSDGDEIRCGNTLLRFYSRPRPLGVELAWPHFNLGIGHFCDGHYDSAVHELTRALDLGSNRDADLHWFLGRCHQARRIWEPASREYAAALAIDGSHHGAHHSKASLLLAAIDEGAVDASQLSRTAIDEAIAHLERATRLAAGRGDYAYDLARLNTLDNRTEEAIKAAQLAVAASPDVVEYQLFLANQARAAGRPELARHAAAAALAIDLGNVEANWIFGDLAFSEGDFPSAAERLEYVRVAEANLTRQRFSGSTDFACRLGRSLFEIGQYRSASQVLAPAAKESRDAMYYIGRCHSCTGHFDSAARIFHRTMSTFGDEPRSRYYLAASLGNAAGDSNCEKALGIVASLENHSDWGVRGLCLSGKLLARLRRFDDAAEKFAQAERLSPDNTDVAFELGRLACIRGDFGRAESAFRAATERTPDDLRMLIWLGRILFAQDKHTAAAECLERSLSCAPSKTLSDDEAQSLRFDAHYYLGRTAFRRNDYANAVAHFENAQKERANNNRLIYDLALSYAYSGKLDDAVANLSSLAMESADDKIIKFNLAIVCCRMATQHFRERRYEQAIQLFEQAADSFRALGRDSELAEVNQALLESRFRLGMVCLFSKRDRLAASLAELERARGLRPDDQRVLYFLGTAYFKRGDYEKAEEQFRQLVEVQNSDPRAISAYALALEQRGNRQEAEKAWTSFSVKIGADSPATAIDGKLGLAGFYARQEDWKRTGELLEQVLEHDGAPGHPAYAKVCKLAVSFLNLGGESKAAEQIIRKHLRGVSPESVDAYLGAVCAQRGSWNEARDYLRRAVKSIIPGRESHVRGSAALDNLRRAKQRKNENAAVLQLFDHVSRLLAAQKVLEEDFAAAAAILNEVKADLPKMSVESQQLLSAVQAAVLLGNLQNGPSEAALKAYETAHRTQPGNPKILRNYAVLCHRLGIACEEQGNSGKSDQHWKRACQLWKMITSDTNGFWTSYLEAYNHKRHRRDRVKTEDLDTIRKRLAQKLSEVHVEFATLYAGDARLMDARRHVGYAGMIDGDGTYKARMSRALLEKFAEVKRGGNDNEALDVCELAYEINPSDKDIQKSYSIAIFNRGTEYLNDGNADKAEQCYKQAEKADPSLLDDEGVRKTWAALHLKRAFEKIEAGNATAAGKCYQDALRVMPTLEHDSDLRQMAAQYYLFEGNRKAGLGDRWGARSSIQKAVQLDPSLLLKVNGLKEACDALGI